MKYAVLTIGLFSLLWSCNNAVEYKTTSLHAGNLAGTYEYGQQEGDDDDKPYGKIALYPESDTTLLFSLFVCVGASSYNLGSTEGRIVLRGDTGYFYKATSTCNCAWSLFWKGQQLHIQTRKDMFQCEFGMGVYADGVYTRTSKEVPQYFLALNGDTVYYKTYIPN